MDPALLCRIAACRACPGMDPWRQFPAEVHGNRHARAMLIGEAPGLASVEAGAYWRGKGGKLLRGALGSLGVRLEEVFYLTDAAKCWPPGPDGKNRSPTRAELAACRGHLRAEIDALQPDYVITCGAVALRAVLACFPEATTDWPHSVGAYPVSESPLGKRLGGFRLIPVLHPSGATRKMDLAAYRGVLLRVFGEVLGSSPPAP